MNSKGSLIDSNNTWDVSKAITLVLVYMEFKARKLFKTFLKCNDGETMPSKMYSLFHDVLFLDEVKKA